MEVVYSIGLDSVEDVHIQNIIKVLRVLSEASRPIAYLIDSIPIGKHICNDVSKMLTLTYCLLLSETYELFLARHIG